MFAKHEVAGVGFLQAKKWSHTDIVHAFSRRDGGVSSAPFATLNVGLHVGDDAEAVWENRARLCRAVGVTPTSLVVGEQVHGRRVAVVSRSHRGRGAADVSTAVSGVDALVTQDPDIVLFGLFADCIPILFFDETKRAVGLAHAGWQGTAHDVAGATLRAMGDAFGSRPRDVGVAIGPGIGACCYEVGADVARRFARIDASPAAAETPVIIDTGGKPRLDLQEANRRLLVDAGVVSERIAVARECTSCRDDRYFSHRAAGGKTGRHAALIGLAAGRTCRT